MALTKATYSMIKGAPVNVLDYGAVGDGVTDDLAAMQAAHNTGKIVYYPEGIYKFSGQVTIAAGGITGAGRSLTTLNCTDTSANAAIKYTGAYTPISGGLATGIGTFQDFSLNGNLLKSGNGAGIQLNSATGSCDYTEFSGVQITYFPINIDFVNASLWKIIGCEILGHTVAGVRVNNTYDNDAGDSMIIGNHFITSVTTATQILQIASSGLKIIGNKLLGGGDAYRMEYTGTKLQAILIIADNSIENFTGKAINLTRISTGLASFKNVIIANNEFAVSLATPTAFMIVSDSGQWLQTMTITGNTFQLPGVTNSYGVALNGVSSLIIESNVFTGNGGNTQAIGLTNCDNAKIGNNTYTAITTPYAITTPGAYNVVALDSQSGSATTASTGWVAYYGGFGLYQSPTLTITFPSAFKMTPSISDCSFTLGSGDGCVSVIAVSVSATQLQVLVIAARSNFAGAINWKVDGVL